MRRMTRQQRQHHSFTRTRSLCEASLQIPRNSPICPSKRTQAGNWWCSIRQSTVAVGYCPLLSIYHLIPTRSLTTGRKSVYDVGGAGRRGYCSLLRTLASRASSLCRSVREREILIDWKRWETVLLIAMLESSSRLAPRKMAMLMACSLGLEAWRSTIIEVSCSLPIPTTIECKYSRVMAMKACSCPSSASKATNQASSRIHGALRSITSMIASSSLITATIEYNHGH